MAFSNSALLKTPTMLEQLLEEINFQRTKEMRQLLKDDSGFVMLQGTTYWTDLFVRHFLFQNENTIDCDDLLFFVRKKHVKSSSRYLPKFETEVDVFRKDSRKLPIGDPDIDWEETVYLNLIIHQFDYTLTLAICTRTSPKELQVLRRHSQKVYASPSRRRMDTKGEVEEMTYPHICFMVDNFDEVFCDILVRDGEMVCVELVASDREGAIQGVIFLGSIRYDALKKVYDARQSSLSTKMAQRMTFGLFSSGAAQRCEFVRMKGPQGKGHAEMAVTKPKGSGVETPTSEPGYCMTDMWDSDWDSDPEEFYQSRHQRRSSDPSANLNNFVRGGWKAKAGTDGIGARARSENEGLDLIDVGVTEIEAGDVRDELMLGRQYTECNHRNDDVDDEPASSSQKSISCVNCMNTTGCCWRNRMSQHDTLSIMSDIYSRPPPSASLKKSRNNSTTSTPGGPGGAQLTLKTLLAHIELGDDATIKCDEINSSPKKQTTNNGPFNRDDFEFADDAISLNDETDCERSQNVCHQTHIIKKESVINVNGKEELPQPCCNKLLSNVIEENEEIDDNNKKIIKNYNSREFIKKTEINNQENNIIEIKIETTSAKYSKNVSASSPATTTPTNNKTETANTEEDLNGNDGTKFLQKLRRYSTLPKSQKLLNQQQRKWLLHNKQSLIVPPHRVTPDGTDIYYWCDIPKKSANELDDGQYNPLWTMRGFTQSFHFWKENKRAQSVPLNAFLTYVTLPWWSIAKDILDHREGPILTF